MLKPFIKWAGGKGQLLSEIRKSYPSSLGENITKYCEPFVGGGAVFFDILNRYSISELYISDINKDLITTYNTVKNQTHELIYELTRLESKYLPLENEERKAFYLNIRTEFNELNSNSSPEASLKKASFFIFLNKTCFNGLFRVNSKGIFNVPMGSYKNPTICDAGNLLKISKALEKVNIHCADYSASLDFVDEKTFVYIDPPYRPLNRTANFNSYNEKNFNDFEQIRLAEFVQQLHSVGAKIVLSNSDPKNVDQEDNFFDDLYNTLNITRIAAKRMINSKAEARGIISELLINNF